MSPLSNLMTHLDTYRYLLPLEIIKHASHIFNTVQLPPNLVNPKSVVRGRKGMKKRRGTTTASQEVNVHFLNSLYAIPSNLGSATLTQSVFETNQQYYSPADIKLFQEQYGLTVTAAIPIGGHTTSSCSIQAGTGDDCYEANLDIQYIMGIAQSTKTKGENIIINL